MVLTGVRTLSSTFSLWTWLTLCFQELERAWREYDKLEYDVTVTRNQMQEQLDRLGEVQVRNSHHFYRIWTTLTAAVWPTLWRSLLMPAVTRGSACCAFLCGSRLRALYAAGCVVPLGCSSFLTFSTVCLSQVHRLLGNELSGYMTFLFLFCCCKKLF